jgi:hypothetical protein
VIKAHGPTDVPYVQLVGDRRAQASISFDGFGTSTGWSPWIQFEAKPSRRSLSNEHHHLQQSKELQKTLEGAASGTGAVDGAEASSPASGAPAAEGDDAEAREEVDGRSVYVGNVSIYVGVPVVDLKGTLCRLQRGVVLRARLILL